MMRDVMESAGLTIYAEIGLIVLFVTFLLAVARTLSRKREYYDKLARIPFDDEMPSEGAGSTEEPTEV